LGKHEPVSLEGIYTDVYLLNEPRAAIRGETRGKRLEGEAAVLHTDALHFVILGKPGGGKTTFLKHIALSVDCPIFITLREWARSGKDLRAFIAEEMAICGLNNIIAETWLREGKAVLLLDGLDEISEKAQRRLDLDRFIRGYPGCRILLTCRGAATPYRSEHFKYVEVADFTDEQVEAFADRWFGDGRSSDFCAEIKQNPHIRDLSRTPLLLGMLCLTYEKQGAFPEKRAELYQQALDALLVEWDESRGIERDAMRRAEIYHELSLGRKHQMFARIAYETFEQGETLIPQAHLEQRLLDYLVTVPDAPERIDIDAKAVLKAIEAQHGILIEFSPRVYAFSHPTFQEYYAARYVVEQDEAGDEQAILRLLAQAHEDRWREVILLAASVLSNADTFFEIFLDWLDAMVKDDAKLVEFFAWAERKAISVKSPYKPACVRAYYAGLALDLVRDFARMNTSTHDLAWALIRFLDSDLTLDSASTSALSCALARASARGPASTSNLARDLARASDLARAFTQTSDFGHALDLAYGHNRDLARAYLRVRYLARDIGNVSLYTMLSALMVPRDDASDETEQIFMEQVQTVMIE